MNDIATLFLIALIGGLVIATMLQLVMMARKESKRNENESGYRESNVARVYFIYPDRERRSKTL